MENRVWKNVYTFGKIAKIAFNFAHVHFLLVTLPIPGASWGFQVAVDSSKKQHLKFRRDSVEQYRVLEIMVCLLVGFGSN